MESAIPYGVLKKMIKSVRQELDELGLDAETLRQLLDLQTVSSSGDSEPIAEYSFGGE